jgi:transcriptional regulator with XRE-family HTH domain
VPGQERTLLKELGKRIRVLREAGGMKQSDLAEALGLNRSHLSEIETGKRAPGLMTLQIIARGLGTSMAELLKGL